MRAVRVLVLVLVLAVTAVAAPEMEQQIEPLAPGVEQRIEVLHPDSEQRVEMVDAQGLQQVAGDATDSAATRGAKVVGKVVLTVVGAALSCAIMVASLLFI